MSNVYYDPEDFGLETVGEFDLREPDFSFDLFVVWKDKATGDFYYATDSGCSCPTPFEDFISLADLTKATKFQVATAIAERMPECPDKMTAANLIARIMEVSA